jgi:hypothetical protein
MKYLHLNPLKNPKTQSKKPTTTPSMASHSRLPKLAKNRLITKPTFKLMKKKKKKKMTTENTSRRMKVKKKISTTKSYPTKFTTRFMVTKMEKPIQLTKMKKDTLSLTFIPSGSSFSNTYPSPK